MSFPIRSPRETVGGIAVFGRILDKIRLQSSQGALPEGYHLGVIPANAPLMIGCAGFWAVDFDALAKRTLEGGNDEEILEWCFENGRRPDDEQIEIWNGFMAKRGWRDAASSGVAQQKHDAGLGDRDDIQTFFDLMDAEEGRCG